MRTLSTTARAAMNAQETGEIFLLLLTITHASLGAPIRVVHNTEDIDSRGETFAHCYFDLELPTDDGESVSSARLTVDNVDRQIVQAIRSITTEPSVLLEIVLASAPHTVEASFEFLLQVPEWNAHTVSAALVFDDDVNSAMPAHALTPNYFPGLF